MLQISTIFSYAIFSISLVRSDGSVVVQEKHGGLKKVECANGNHAKTTLPDLYRYDNYVQCLEQGSAFCMVRAVVKPNSSNEVWNHVQVC